MCSHEVAQDGDHFATSTRAVFEQFGRDLLARARFERQPGVTPATAVSKA